MRPSTKPEAKKKSKRRRSKGGWYGMEGAVSALALDLREEEEEEGEESADL